MARSNAKPSRVRAAWSTCFASFRKLFDGDAFERQDENQGRAVSDAGGGGAQYTTPAGPRSGSRAGARTTRPQDATKVEAPNQKENRSESRAPQVVACRTQDAKDQRLG